MGTAREKSPVTADRSPPFAGRRVERPGLEQHLIMLLDIDAFFASAEQVARSDLKGKPVIVGGLATDRSVVASASYEARALGVRTAMPIAQAARICPQGVFLRGNYQLYSSLSQKVIEICNTFAPIVQQASIDEAYMDLTGTQRMYAGHGRQRDAETRRRGDTEARRQGDSRQKTGDRRQETEDGRQEDAGVAPGNGRGQGTGGRETRGRGDAETRGRGDTEKGRQGDRRQETEDRRQETAHGRQGYAAVAPGNGRGRRTGDRGQLTTATAAPAGKLPVAPGISEDFSVSPCLRGSSHDMEPRNWPVDVAEKLLREIRRQTGLGATIGIGSNKLVARLAMERAKPSGVCFVWCGYEAAFLAMTPLSDIPGIGRRTAAMLRDYNLHTAGDVQRTDLELLIATFGERFGRLLHDCAWGRGEEHLELEYEQKSISRDTSFEQDTTDMGYIKSMLYYLTERACRALRRMHRAAWTVSVKLRYSDFATVGKSRTLPEPSNQDNVVYKAAEALLEKLYTRAISVRLVGVHLSVLVGDGQKQLRIWEPQQLRHDRLYQASDRIRDRFGFCALMKGPAIELMGKMEQDSAGLKLRTSCLTK